MNKKFDKTEFLELRAKLVTQLEDKVDLVEV